MHLGYVLSLVQKIQLFSPRILHVGTRIICISGRSRVECVDCSLHDDKDKIEELRKTFLGVLSFFFAQATRIQKFALNLKLVHNKYSVINT